MLRIFASSNRNNSDSRAAGGFGRRPRLGVEDRLQFPKVQLQSLPVYQETNIHRDAILSLSILSPPSTLSPGIKMLPSQRKRELELRRIQSVLF